MKTLSIAWLIMAFTCLILQAILNETMISIYVMGCILASSIYNVGHKLQKGEE